MFLVGGWILTISRGSLLVTVIGLSQGNQVKKSLIFWCLTHFLSIHSMQNTGLQCDVTWRHSMTSRRHRMTSRRHMTSHHDVATSPYDVTTSHDVIPWHNTWCHYDIMTSHYVVVWRHNVTWRHSMTSWTGLSKSFSHCFRRGICICVYLSRQKDSWTNWL